MSIQNDINYEKKLNAMKVAILSAEKANINNRERTDQEMSDHILKIIKTIDKRKDFNKGEE